MRLFSRKIDSEKTNKLIVKNVALKNFIMFIIGTLIYSLSFNLFYLPFNLVSGGLSGVAVILNYYFEWSSTLVLLVGNIFFIILSIFTLGWKKSLMSAFGAITFILFVYLTEGVPNLINFSFDNGLLYVLAAGVAGGFGESLIYKAGYNSGGTSILALILQKYTNKTIGELLRYISIFIVTMGALVFGYTSIMYSIIIISISTYMVDKMLIGKSKSKTFFIQSNKKEEIIDFILKIVASGVTEFESKGAYSHKRKDMIMCVVPNDKYTLLKNAIHQIDPDAFIVVSDCYEVLGGTKRKKLLFDDI